MRSICATYTKSCHVACHVACHVTSTSLFENLPPASLPLKISKMTRTETHKLMKRNICTPTASLHLTALKLGFLSVLNRPLTFTPTEDTIAHLSVQTQVSDFTAPGPPSTCH